MTFIASFFLFFPFILYRDCRELFCFAIRKANKNIIKESFLFRLTKQNKKLNPLFCFGLFEDEMNEEDEEKLFFFLVLSLYGNNFIICRPVKLSVCFACFQKVSLIQTSDSDDDETRKINIKSLPVVFGQINSFLVSVKRKGKRDASLYFCPNSSDFFWGIIRTTNIQVCNEQNKTKNKTFKQLFFCCFLIEIFLCFVFFLMKETLVSFLMLLLFSIKGLNFEKKVFERQKNKCSLPACCCCFFLLLKGIFSGNIYRYCE